MERDSNLEARRDAVRSKVNKLLEDKAYEDTSSLRLPSNTLHGVALNSLKGQSIRRMASIDTQSHVDVRIRELSTARFGKRKIQNLYIDSFTMGDAEGRSYFTLWEYDLANGDYSDEVYVLLDQLLGALPQDREELSWNLSRLYKKDQ